MANGRKYRHRRAGRFSGLTRVGRQFDQVILWTLRGLVLTDVTKKCHNDIEEYPYNIEKIFRLDEYAEEHTGAHCVRKYLGELLQKYERRQISRSTVIHRNIELIGKMLKLKKAEKELLLFMTFLNSEEILKELSNLDADTQLMFKLTIPSQADFYRDLMEDAHVVRVVALSGGYSRVKANEKLAKNHGLIASFSRALAQGLSVDQTDEEFNATLGKSIEAIYQASIT